LLLIAACGGSSSTPVSSLASPSETATPGCTGDPHDHVYNPDRLKLLVACVTADGTVDSITAEPDGDFHVRLHLDAGQTCGGEPCLIQHNLSDQGGDLVLEPVCENPITQADAASACAGYANHLVVPPVGTHVAATGPFVLDVDHNWNEIHPLEAVTVLTPLPAPPSPSPAPTAGVLTVSITDSSYGYVAAVTLPGASCTAKAKLPSGRISTAAGLQAAIVAGDDGIVSWSYGTSSTTKPGTGTHTVTCSYGGKTVSATAPFTVG